MPLWQLIVLAVVQGVSEFLPISSSGHLVIVEALFGTKTDLLEVNVALHAGTLLSILVFYWRRVWRLVSEDRRVVLLLFVGSLPAGVVGVTLKATGAAEEMMENALLAGCCLILTGAVLLITGRFTSRPGGLGHEHYQAISVGKALLIGLSQAVAILPGVSRSGSTICTALGLGLAPQSAATFSFLLAIPAIGGAALVELVKGVGETTSATPATHLAIGIIVSFVVGLASLQWLVTLLEKGRLQLFAWWCIPVGAAVIAWQIAS
jgi:undecaprenyl-diphosphatase